MKAQDARSLKPEALKLLRIKAVEMVFQHGVTIRQTAKVLAVSRQHVAKWCQAFEAGGYPALALGRRGRRPGEQQRLAPWQCALIVRLITDRTPDQLKMPFVLWERIAVRELILQRFNLTLALRTVSDYLKRWNMTAQRPVEQAYQRRPEAVQRWLTEEYPAIRARAAAVGGVVLWGDETGAKNSSHSARSFAPRGQTPVVRTDARHLKANVISAISNRGHVRFMVYETKLTQQVFIRFLARLIKGATKPIFLIVDNLKVHHGKLVKAWLAQHAEQLVLCFLPSYSPELNPDEYLNRDLKRNLNLKRTPRTAAELRANLNTHLRMLQRQPSRVRGYFASRHIAYAAA